MQYKLKIGGKTMTLSDGEYDIGRMSDCWLTLDDDLASRYHARIRVRGTIAEVEDLGSRNGTYLNGERVDGVRPLADGDEVQIGRETIAVIGPETTGPSEIRDARRTLTAGDDIRFPSLIGQLVQKSLRVGKLKEAERYASALVNQLTSSKVRADHPAAEAAVDCLMSLAERSNSGIWIDRVFGLYASQSWTMDNQTLERIRSALDRIPRIPGRGIKEYENRLRAMAREGAALPPGLTATIAELADAYGGG